MKTATLSYPRIEKNRELKFLTESYFKGAIDSNELLSDAKTLCTEHWRAQSESGIDRIPSGDFSLYVRYGERPSKR